MGNRLCGQRAVCTEKIAEWSIAERSNFNLWIHLHKAVLITLHFTTTTGKKAVLITLHFTTTAGKKAVLITLHFTTTAGQTSG